ncbi:hypothetical protein ACRAKI_22075 [Saccharothrix isguenensis]
MLLVVGILLFVAGSYFEETVHEYQVHFSNAGDKCGDKGVHIDEDTGDLLRCYSTAQSGPGTGLSFTAEERDRVVALAKELATDGSLSDVDKEQVKKLVDSIAAEHVDLDRWSDGAETLGFIISMAGGVLFVISGIRLLAFLG